MDQRRRKAGIPLIDVPTVLRCAYWIIIIIAIIQVVLDHI